MTGLSVEVPFSLEEWRPIPDTDGWYEASSLGRLRSWKTYGGGRRQEPRVLNPVIDAHGYRAWSHRLFGKCKRLTVHRSVCMAFHGPPPTGGLRPEVRHLDGDRLNNMAENLAWGFASDNAADRVRHGTSLAGERSPFARLTRAQVAAIRESERRLIRELSEQYSISRQHIRKIIAGAAWTESTNGCS